MSGDVSLSTSRARFAKQQQNDCIRDNVDSRAWQPTDCVTVGEFCETRGFMLGVDHIRRANRRGLAAHTLTHVDKDLMNVHMAWACGVKACNGSQWRSARRRGWGWAFQAVQRRGWGWASQPVQRRFDKKKTCFFLLDFRTRRTTTTTQRAHAMSRPLLQQPCTTQKGPWLQLTAARPPSLPSSCWPTLVLSAIGTY